MKGSTMDKQEFIDLLDSIDNTEYACDIVDTIYLKHHFEDYVDMSEQDVIEHCIEEYVHTYEVIYSHNAMDYLADNDPSLRESMELAYSYACNMSEVNSELLATIHIQQQATNELWELMS